MNRRIITVEIEEVTEEEIAEAFAHLKNLYALIELPKDFIEVIDILYQTIFYGYLSQNRKVINKFVN